MMKSIYSLIILGFLLQACAPPPTAEDIAKAMIAEQEAQMRAQKLKSSAEHCEEYQGKKRNHMEVACRQWRGKMGYPEDADIIPSDLN